MLEDKKKKIIDNLISSFQDAGNLSLKLREKGLKEEIKIDNTPVTNGDIEVNKLITYKIEKLTPEISIVSEESSENKSNENLKTFWLIDPIDGTYDYINGRDEFTINAALIINNKPEVGIIYAPAKKRLFYTYHPGKCFELSNNLEKKLNCSKLTKKGEIKAVSYSNKLKPIIADWHNKFNVTNYTKMKSSFKFCVIASGEYDLYIAEPRACEWDIAAGHIILEEAGGSISNLDKNKILYNTKESVINPYFIAKN